MNDFWNNVFRYPRFFISSMIGLIVVILTPFKSVFQIKKFRFITIGIGFICLFTIINILKIMSGL